MMAINSPVNSPTNSLGNITANSRVKDQGSDTNKVKLQDAEQEDRSDYQQVSSEVEKAEQGQHGDTVSPSDDTDSELVTAGLDDDSAVIDGAGSQAVNPNSVIQPAEALSLAIPGAEPVSVVGRAGHNSQGEAAMPPVGKVSPDTRVNQGQSIAVLQSIKHQTQTIESTATDQVQIKQQISSQIKSDPAIVAASADATAAVKEAMALAKSTLTTAGQNPLSSSHDGKKTLDVTTLRVEQQVGDVALIDRLSSQPAPVKHEWSAVKLDNQQQNWSKQLFNVLQDRIEMQINQHIKQAKIRLDPPELGRLDLTVRFEGDRMSVVVQAGNASVREALQASLEQLRGELANQFGASVDVNVGGDDSLAKEFKESENNVALHSFEEQETIESVTAHQSGWFNALA